MADEDEELSDVFVGRVLDGRYRLTERLGAGGMGAVYSAVHEPFGRRVAVKILHPQLAMDAELMRRFKNEAKASGTLGHPHIASAFDFGRTQDGAPYIAMEFLEGRDLGDVIAEDGPFPIDRAVAIADQIADGLDAAHAQGIVHRDIKPENVFLCAGEQVKILDFGISKFSEDDSSVTTKTGAFMGSLYYMAPEQVADASRADGRADIYALGALLYKMLSGRTVFEPDALPMLIVAIANDDPAPLTDLRRDVPAGLSALVAQMLAKAPDERPQSMREVRAALDAYARIDSAPILLVPKVDAVASGAAPASQVRSKIVLPRSRRPALLGAGLAILIGVGGVAAVAMTAPDDPPAEPELGPAALAPEEPAPAAAAAVDTDPAGPATADPVDPAETAEGPIPDGRTAPAEGPSDEDDEAAPPRVGEATARPGRRRLAAPRAAEPSNDPPRDQPTRIDGVLIDDSY